MNNNCKEELFWPVPAAKKVVPRPKHKRGFARNHRDNRFHAGVDIVALAGSDVVSIENGVVANVFLFTYPGLDKHYKYEKTYAVAVKHGDGKYALYCELQRPRLKVGDRVRAGQRIGKVGMIFADKPNHAMLHFELHGKLPRKTTKWFAGRKPEGLLNPTKYLERLI